MKANQHRRIANVKFVCHHDGVLSRHQRSSLINASTPLPIADSATSLQANSYKSVAKFNT
ncbi:hypothetical protein SERLA73DRAFT_190303 [Serpula lacrymans var. lacrymans S7.3]|uniref:Uncharacterized protein n=1 Tax=Serpula lacrymans var. lacrymans (strain S7.3) TaxID=936435 RepID=F8QFE8_SERL3|nr:hypothetical protein SERLA73DRAFT_190303 [Serpula lacrymans var. lacrymans S7.3]